jgi:D-inositol-3-phosphate glycosyltransferase
MQHPSVLLIGEAAAPTGYARVSRSLFERLQDRYRITQLATRYEGGAHDLPWPLIIARNGDDLYGYSRIAQVIQEVQPDLIFSVYDMSLLVGYMRCIREVKHHAAIVFYVPVEAGPIDPRIPEELSAADCLVAYTKYGRNELLAASYRLAAPPRIEVIPHGVDLNCFYPLSTDRQEARMLGRRMLKLTDPHWQNAFIVLNANRNMERKRIDLSMRGFAAFARHRPNAYLYLHMGMLERGWHLQVLAERYGIAGRLLLTTDTAMHPNVSNSFLNALYNACDVGISTSSGEGWGLLNFEHAATGAALVLPRHTALAELWSGAADFLDPVITLNWPGTLASQFIVNDLDLAAALTRLYEDPVHLAMRARQAFEVTQDEHYHWEKIALQWDALFQELLMRTTSRRVAHP